MAKGLSSSKVELIIGDGFDFMKKHTNEFDIIITDSSDPIGKSKVFNLYSLVSIVGENGNKC